ncbi:hypothetical protein KM043_011227 [Ampulex compressa]|nr:hypothetical protein KM043_011227 [Ampulex compressa]
MGHAHNSIFITDSAGNHSAKVGLAPAVSCLRDLEGKTKPVDSAKKEEGQERRYKKEKGTHWSSSLHLPDRGAAVQGRRSQRNSGLDSVQRSDEQRPGLALSGVSLPNHRRSILRFPSNRGAAADRSSRH